MTVRFTSTAEGARERGAEFGETFRTPVRTTVERYRELFGLADLAGPGAQAYAAIEAWAPALAAEIGGLAAGAGLPVTDLAAVNARTEILAARRGTAGECSTVVALRGPGEEPVAAQNWDWYGGFADGWLVWEIPHGGGRRTVTLTEYGIVGKIGVSAAGIGCLINILHHRRDGGPPGVPVHVIARRILDEAPDVAAALKLAGAARVSASTALTVVGGTRAGKTAITAELWPGGPGHVLPDQDGLLLHTNHFLTRPAADGDTEPITDPDTLVRYDVLRRALTGQGRTLTAEGARAVLREHIGDLCAHAETPADFQTLASVRLDLDACGLDVVPGPPCLS